MYFTVTEITPHALGMLCLSQMSLPTRLVCYVQLCVSSDVARYGERSRVILLTKCPD
jgi:hypothetical protein